MGENVQTGGDAFDIPPQPDNVRDDRLRKALLWVGAVSAVSAVAAFIVVRATIGRTQVDPTGDRIQDLIDEANRLLKSLDDTKRG